MAEMFKAKWNGKDIIAFLRTAEKKLGDLSPLMKAARVELKGIIDENFETEGKHTGDKWKEWSDEWKKQRMKMGEGSGKILNLSGKLRKTIMAKSDRNTATIYTNRDYAAIHNFGGNKKLKRNKTMPRREFMRINDTQVEYLLADLKISLEEMLMKAEANKKVFGK